MLDSKFSQQYCHGRKFLGLFLSSGFEADFPYEVSLKMLNSADNKSLNSDLVSVYLKVFDH